jgi:DNA-3-methyladenine glycosylase I
MSYCSFCIDRPLNDIHRDYHDNAYGFPILDDNELFGRLILEINQAGLSWDIILKKQHTFREAYDGYDISKVSSYDENKVLKIMSDPGVIRNRKKIEAAIYNARKIGELQNTHGSFLEWLNVQNCVSSEEWVKLFRRTFKFVGKEIVEEFLMSTGFLPGAHDESCPVYEKVIESKPKWLHT